MSFDTRANTPAHALAFTPDAVHLLRREGGRWLPVGQAHFDDSAMREALDDLRQTAGPQTVLPVRVMIPDDQILYTDVTIDPARPRSEALMRALEGLTPYEVADLAWDCAETNEESRLRVAAVARKTLSEAEEFARTHGFAPDGFGALPGADRFPHEPRFDEQHLEAGILARAEDEAETEAFAEGDEAPENLKDTLNAIAALVREGRAIRADDAPAGVAAEAGPQAVTEPDLAGVTDPVAFPDDRPAPVISRIPQHVYAPAKADTSTLAPKVPAPEPMRAETPVPVKPVPPRAQALLARAAEARASRESRPETPPQRHAPAVGGATRAIGYRRKGLQGLGLPLGVLLVGLAAAWMLLPGNESPEPAAVTQTGAPVVQPESAPVQSDVIPTEPLPVEPSLIEAAPAEVTQAEPQPAAEPQPQVTAQPPAPALVTAPLSTTSPATAPEVATPVAEAPAEPAPVPIAPQAAPTAVTTPEPAQPTVQTPTQAQSGEIAASAVPVARPNHQTPPQTPAASAPAPGVPAVAPTSTNNALSRSARPISRAATRAQPPAADAAPRVPEVPAPFAERATRPLTASRPNARPSDLRRVYVPPPAQAAPTPAATPAATTASKPAPAPTAPDAAPARPAVGASSRPRPRPPLEEGSAAEPEFEPPLTTAEQQHLRDLRLSLQYAQAGGVGSAPPPRRRSGTSTTDTAPRASTNAIEGAVAEAVSAAPRGTNTATRSPRPPHKPASIARASGSSASVNDAIAAAMAESAPESAGGAALSAKRPVRRSRTIASTPESAAPSVQVAAAPLAPPTAPVAVAPVPVPNPAPNPVPQPVPLPETRSVTIAPTPQPKVESRQIYVRPPEADDEPDDRVASAGATSASVARTATQRGVLSNRTTLIGIYGSGRTARGLIRTSNGRFVKVKLGDRLDGGIVNSIGNGQLTYVKNGRQMAMKLLDGR